MHITTSVSSFLIFPSPCLHYPLISTSVCMNPTNSSKLSTRLIIHKLVWRYSRQISHTDAALTDTWCFSFNTYLKFYFFSNKKGASPKWWKYLAIIVHRLVKWNNSSFKKLNEKIMSKNQHVREEISPSIDIPFLLL